MQAQASMRARHRPDRAFVEAVSRRKFYPVSHRESDVAAGGLARLAGTNGSIAVDREPIGAGALLRNLAENGEVAGWCGIARLADGGGRDERRPVAFHDIDGDRPLLVTA